MKLDKLIKKLKREVLASPQKAGALGLLVLVAGYFWGPLVMKWGKKGAPSAASAVATPMQPSVASTGTITADASEPTSNLGWQQIELLLAQDPLMRPASLELFEADPFVASIPEKVVPAEETPVTEAENPTEIAEAPSEPAEYVVTLTSVVIGPRAKRATINGKAVREGEWLTLTAENRVDPHQVLVKRITSQGVLLVPKIAGDAELFVPFKPHSLADGEQIQRLTKSATQND